MSSVAVFVRLALIIGLLVQLSQAAAPYAAGLILPGLGAQDTSDRVCRSLKICHNSKGAAWTTVQLFSALEPLLHQLKLEPATEFVEVRPLQGCLSSGCCCSTPVEVRFSLPIHRNKRTAAAELAAVTDFLQFKLARELKGTACTAGVLGECPYALAAERKLLSPEDDTLPPLPEGLIPYDGKKPILEVEDYTPPKPKSQPKPQPPKAKTPADDPSKDPVLPEGLIPYDHKTTRQLLEEMEAAIDEAAVATVPEMPAISISAINGAAILESGTPGAYGSSSSSGRSLLEADSESVGGYGGRSLLEIAEAAVGAYGGAVGGAGRSLLGEPAAKSADSKPAEGKKQPAKQQGAPKKQDSAPKKQDSAPKKAEGAKAAAPKKEQQQQQPKKASEAPQATPKKLTDSSSSSSSSAPCSASNGTNSVTAPNGRPYGTCYCRYNPQDSTWALEQAACRAALFQRCRAAGALLQCTHVEAFYKGLAMPGSEAPHRDTITAFLYADCPPAPPCSCKALLEGSETATARARCCTDLQAHCQVPFSGLDCEDVGRFCRPYGRQSADPLGALFSFVLVKTHGFDCSSPKYAVSYATVASTANGRARSDVDDAIRQLSKAAMVEGITRYDSQMDSYSEADRVAALLTMLVGGCFAVFVAAIGVAVIFKMVSARNHHTIPLLSDRL